MNTLKLKVAIHVFILVSTVALVWAGVANAQPVPAPRVVVPAARVVPMQPAPRVTRPTVRAMKPVSRVRPVTRVMKPVKPLVVLTMTTLTAPPAMLPVPATPALTPVLPMAVPTAPVMEPPTTEATPVVPVEPEWKKPGFWISKVIVPVLGVVLLILVAFGVIKKEWLKWLQDKQVIQIADKVVTQFEVYAKGTAVLWDDVLAQALKAVVARAGVITEEQKALVKAVVDERAEQAEKRAPVSSAEDSDESGGEPDEAEADGPEVGGSGSEDMTEEDYADYKAKKDNKSKATKPVDKDDE